MTYFNLRKRAPEAEPEAVDEEEFDEADDEPDTVAAPPAGWADALRLGITGPGAWITARFGITTAWTLHAFALWAVGYYGRWIAAGIVTAWTLAVLAFVPREYLDRAAAGIERLATAVERRLTGAPKPPASPTPGGEREAVRRLLLDLIGDTHGVHLKTVLAHLQEHGQWEGKKVADLRRHLEALGIPVDPKLRVGRVPTRGVSRAALEALPPIKETSPSPTQSHPI